MSKRSWGRHGMAQSPTASVTCEKPTERVRPLPGPAFILPFPVMSANSKGWPLSRTGQDLLPWVAARWPADSKGWPLSSPSAKSNLLFAHEPAEFCNNFDLQIIVPVLIEPSSYARLKISRIKYTESFETHSRKLTEHLERTSIGSLSMSRRHHS